jgi:hypothetical protein
MIIRIAHFHTLSPVGREWILDALQGVPGIRSAFHATPEGGSGYVTVGIFDDETAIAIAEDAIARRRVELGIEGQGPDDGPIFYNVHHLIANE